MPEVGDWDSRSHGTEFELGPYARLNIGGGIGTVGLVECDAVAIQVIAERSRIRVDLGSCIPVNGKTRYLCNPYSRTIRGRIIEDAAVSLKNNPAPSANHFTQVHRTSLTKNVAGLDGQKSGMLFMPKRGEFFAHFLGLNTMLVSIIPKAKLEYLDALPDGLFGEEVNAFGCEGLANETLVARFGNYTDAEIGAWIAETGWNAAPIRVSNLVSNYNATANGSTALLVHYEEGKDFRINMKITDLGDWSPDWRG